jgi:exoribonuclease-2
VAEDLLVERVDAGAVVVDHVDRRVKVLEDGAVDVTLKICNSRADLLVSELMVMANVEAARLCVEQGAPAIFRVQKAPDLANVEPTEIEPLHRFRVLTKMRAASASLEPGLHGGLGVEPYCQATSPLRRFTDLVSQRQLVAVIGNLPLPYTSEDLAALSGEIEERLRLINRLERRRERYWLLYFLSAQRGEVFDALVMNVWDRRARIEVREWALQVDVRISGKISEGEMVSARLTRIDPWADEIVFVLV